MLWKALEKMESGVWVERKSLQMAARRNLWLVKTGQEVAKENGDTYSPCPKLQQEVSEFLNRQVELYVAETAKTEGPWGWEVGGFEAKI